MKQLFDVVIAAAAFATACTALSAGLDPKSHSTIGIVQAIDRNTGTATIAHEPVASMKWSAMTMQFSVADVGLLERLQVRQTVAFEFIDANGSYRIVNAIPLTQGASRSEGGSMEMMGSMREGKRWWQFWR